jgi:hypothetical protein
MLLNTFYTARRFEEDLKIHQNENLKIQTQLLQENFYLRTVCESTIQKATTCTTLNLPNLDFFSKLLSSEKDKKHKKTATAIFDDSVCFKINLDEKESEELPEKDTSASDKKEQNMNTDYSDKSEKSNQSTNFTQSHSMLKKLSMFKSKPKLFLFHSTGDGKEDVNSGKGMCNTQENLVSRNKLF